MAEYKAIHGTLFQHKTSDPLAAGISNGTWASGGSLNTARNDLDGSGTQTAGLAFGGNPNKAETEEYDGTSWTESGDLNTARRALTGFGVQTATIATGGSEGPYNDETEQYNGSSWTEIAEINTAGGGSPGSCGTTTAGLVFGRRKLPGATKGGETETWNGSSWTEVGDLNTARFSVGGLGTQTAALAVSGAPPHYANVEQWNGSSWTEVGDINSARSAGGASGTTTSALYFVGEDGTGVRNLTEAWDGSAWTEIADASAGAGKVADSDSSSTAAFFAGGDGPPGGAVATTEEFTAAQITDSIVNDGQCFYRSDTGDFKISLTAFGTGAFSTGTNLPGARTWARGVGIQTATLCLGGTNTSPSYAESVDTLSYNGTAWTELAASNTGRANGNWAADGTQTAAIQAGGQDQTIATVADSETWNGSSWTEVSELNTARDNLTSTSGGTTTASLAFMGGTPSPYTGRTELWNGSAWSEQGDLNNARERGAGGGSSTAAIAIDGARAPNVANPDGVSFTETWDGTSWTEVADTNTAHYYGAAWGTTTSAIVVGTAPANNVVEQWNGSAWTEVAEMNTNRLVHDGGTGGPANTSGIIHGGDAPPYSVAVEEWNIPESISNLTITD